MPTLKQKMAFNKIAENHGNVSKTMKEVGYSESSAINPQNLTNSKGWEELMEEYLPDSLLAKKHKELLTIKRKIRHFKKGDLETEVEELDSNAVKAGLDMGYKLKGKYAAEKKDITSGGLTLTDILKEIDERKNNKQS